VTTSDWFGIQTILPGSVYVMVAYLLVSTLFSFLFSLQKLTPKSESSPGMTA